MTNEELTLLTVSAINRDASDSNANLHNERSTERNTTTSDRREATP